MELFFLKEDDEIFLDHQNCQKMLTVHTRRQPMRQLQTFSETSRVVTYESYDRKSLYFATFEKFWTLETLPNSKLSIIRKVF